MMSLQLQIALFLLIAVSSVYSRRTQCMPWKGDSQYRCAKDNYHEDSIHIQNVSNLNVSFKVSKWKSTCGKPGSNYSIRDYAFGPGRSVDVDFSAAGPNICNELFVYDCKINGRAVNCIDAVLATPNYPR